MNKIVAIVGMCGSGKSIASELLEKLGWYKVYFGGVTMKKLQENNIEITPDNEKVMREKLRSELGMGAYAKILLPEIDELSKKGNVVLDGLYSWDELNILQEYFNNQIIVVAVIVDKEIRYERLSKREIRPLTNEEAVKRDIAEIENSAKAGPIAYADYYIDNNNELDSYYKRIDEILKHIEEVSK